MMHSLKKLNPLIGLVTLITELAVWLPVAKADSTADLLVSLQCQDYQIQIWQNRLSNTYLYRSQSFMGNLAIDQGSRTATEGVTVYKFRNGDYEYWVWDGTLDSPNAGTWEIYRNSRLVLQQNCTKS